jgi:UDP-N-acetylglucosamine--N-acetylmuramyl-(pentapeptide) pyrophosphoryl-undecaprenol N-acetylglucosamine transferase
MRVLVAAGSSGGHVFPALSFLKQLKTKYGDNLEALLILPQNCISSCKEGLPCRVKYVSIFPLKIRSGFKNVLAVFNFLKGAGQSLFILIDFRPDVAVGFGSLVSIPVIIFAWLMRTGTLIHEQNVIPGRANRLLSMFADRIAISFPQTRVYFQRQQKKIVYTGNPIRPELTKTDKHKALGFFGLDSGKFTVLVAGGSQASHRINVEFLKAAAGISGSPGIQIIHLCGKSDYDFLNRGYKGLGVKARVFEFLRPMHYAYSAADLIVSRAGALTVSEIIFFSLPAILIPYPYAWAHQLANARILEESGCAFIIKDEQLNADTLKNRIGQLISDAKSINNMRLAYRNFSIPDANDELERNVLGLAAWD